MDRPLSFPAEPRKPAMSLAAPTVLFDLDGTLIDSQAGILSSCKAALRALGHEPAPTFDVAAVIGPPIDDVMRVLLSPHGDDRVTEAVAAYREDYGTRGLYQSAAYPGIAETLSELRAAGATLYVATSKRTDFARRILEHLGLAGHFAGIYGGEPGGALDHKPELLAHILAQEGLRPEQCVMIGDRRFDISGAHANRMRAIGVLWGYGSRDELETAGADQLITSPGELMDAALQIAERPSA